jgi:hypothetical protein
MSRMLIPALLALAGCQLPPLREQKPPEKSEADYARLEAAREKRRRKLERFTNTPQARARRVEMEAEFQRGDPIPPPDPEIVAMTE